MIFNEIFYENRQMPNELIFIRQAGELLYDTDYSISRSGSRTHCLGFVKSGKMRLCFNGKEYVIAGGQSVFLPSNTEYTLSSDKREPPRFIWFNIRGHLADGISEVLYGGCCKISEFELTDTAVRLKELLRSETDFKTEISELIFRAMLEISVSEITDRSVNGRPSEYELYISNSIQSGFSVASMADFFHCSTDTLNRQFRKSFGVTPYSYYQKMRMEIAKSMLCETDLTVDDIAERLNFNDRNHFSLCFKKSMGVAPVKYKKKNGEIKL